MKTLADTSFFRAFEQLAAASNPSSRLHVWTYAGVDWRRERHSFAGSDHSFVVEVYTLVHAAPPSWTLLLTKEHWWGRGGGDPLKNTQWARPTTGSAADVLSWLRAQQRLLEEA